MSFFQEYATQEQNSFQRAWVAFSGQTELRWLRFLKSGFRHCFVILHDGQCWLTLDPLSNTMELYAHHNLPAEFDLPLWIEGRGFKVVEAPIVYHKKPAPFMLFSCVEVVKRILGIHKISILTPWQLYRYLGTQSKKNKLSKPKLKGDLSWEA